MVVWIMVLTGTILSALTGAAGAFAYFFPAFQVMCVALLIGMVALTVTAWLSGRGARDSLPR